MRLGHVYGCKLDANGATDVSEELRPEALFSGHSWPRAWYYGDVFEWFAFEIVLEYRTRTGTIRGIRSTFVRHDKLWRVEYRHRWSSDSYWRFF